jgi:hypothetical protein
VDLTTTKKNPLSGARKSCETKSSKDALDRQQTPKKDRKVTRVISSSTPLRIKEGFPSMWCS